MILVTGAGGKTGKAVIRALAQQREPVRAYLRRAAQADAGDAFAASEAIIGDLLDAAQMQAAVQGVRAVYHICPNMHPDEAAMGRTVIAAAQAAGVERFVYHSVLHPQTETMPHHWNNLRVEEMIFESGLPFTILQPTAYMQNLLAGWRAIREQGRYAVPYPAASRLSLVDLQDVGAAAARVLTEPGHLGATYELAGTPPLAQTEVASILGEILGRSVHAEEVRLADWEQSARAGGLGDYAIDTLLKMFRYYARNGLAGNPNILQWLLGRPPTTLPEFVERSARR
jgi:uncharacterized protein YbjT (DUF2867 family)